MHLGKSNEGHRPSLEDGNCPCCHSATFYRYGKPQNRKQRFLCPVCGRQFTRHTKRNDLFEKPICPKCGNMMNLYKREGRFLRFGCSDYPVCLTYTKLAEKKIYDRLPH